MYVVIVKDLVNGEEGKMAAAYKKNNVVKFRNWPCTLLPILEIVTSEFTYIILFTAI